MYLIITKSIFSETFSFNNISQWNNTYIKES